MPRTVEEIPKDLRDDCSRRIAEAVEAGRKRLEEAAKEAREARLRSIRDRGD